jgi:ketosteroid isomerase-like protein
MSTDLETTVRRYDEAWAEEDDQKRLRILAQIWADDGLYIDPDVPDGIRGPAALASFIGQSFEELPGLAISSTSDVAVLGDRAWYRWTATTKDGQSFSGTDFVEFAPDGRIARLTNFYDA